MLATVAFKLYNMKSPILALMVLMQIWLVVLSENPINEATTAPTSGSPIDIPAQVTEFLHANPQIAAATASAPASPDTKCECAVFNSKTPAEIDNPIITQAPINVNCDSTGEENCLKLCSALAQAAKERGPELLCSHLGHYNQLMASVHSRICGARIWTYTGLTAPNEICCHENKVIDCKDQVAEPVNPPPNQL